MQHFENFKRLQKVEISLNHSSIFVGPGGTGKTSALQALKFWHTAISKFHRNKYLKEPTVILEREDLDFLGLVNLSHCWSNGARL